MLFLSLLALDIATAPGRAGEALTRAQQELAASLRSFPESAPMQTTLPCGHGDRPATSRNSLLMGKSIAFAAAQASRTWRGLSPASSRPSA